MLFRTRQNSILCSSRMMRLHLHLFSFSFAVGYDSAHMILDGRFNYELENQRTLPFNVDILPLPETKRIVIGSSSNYHCSNNIIKIYSVLERRLQSKTENEKSFESFGNLSINIQIDLFI